MKTLLTLSFILITSAIGFGQQHATGDLEYGTPADIKPGAKIFVYSEDEDARTTIIRMLRSYEGIEVVNSTKEAEVFIEYGNLTRDVAANRGPGAMGASMALKSQMRVYFIKPDGTKVIAWKETETFDVTNGMAFGAPNEANLTHHFVRDLQETRNEKPYSMRQLYKGRPKPKK